MNRKFGILLVVVALTSTAIGVALADPDGGSAPPASSDTRAPSRGFELKSRRIGSTYPIRFVFYVTETALFETSSQAWQNLPGAWINVRVKGDYALVFGRFTAQTGCVGGAGYCHVRIAYRKLPSGVTRFMDPAGGMIVDSSGVDVWETHSIEQAIPTNVGPGTYRAWVQVATTPGTGSAPLFSLDNWTFTGQAAWS